ncbi:hypothetical protein CLOBY_26840 [Clostridium saccharobutylicum]|uniref:hypothetical protein n=1 Tax=Clostridium saccharobutylicum TaxID=169679 RepID=UPI000983DC68|nr:hypothetical protein [Clostridium saccharobutylicum]AQS10539.1 hypothetical protein CLOBY_26840 [Clostridium saccharobutylicum]MBC2438436.1 hypothetical protein [Clostridium saccharobutylicum]NSB90847.1 hypothetical protein [Clostridium saccharobutylicum]NYC31493.1 hypothetical protein [Clostridium saccharobutylicum]OOM18432.1 hypothetical protein CLSAB_07290 [Clostridium saccharobutylicum]
MEHSKLVAFTIKCNKCSRGWSVDKSDFEKTIINCQNPECNNQFTVYEGLRNGLKSYEDFIPNPFLANDMFNGTVDVKIGYTTYFDLPKNIRKTYNIMIMPSGAFLAGAVDITKKGFRIFTSLPDDGDNNLIGKSEKVLVIISAKTDDYNVPWIEMLRYAFEQLRNEEYLTSILFSEIAFEIYTDTMLAEGYKKIGLDEDSISRFLIATDIPIKVNPLMGNLYNIKLSDSATWKKWEKKVLKWRNGIAHGTKVKATEEEAKLVYETVVDSIFYFFEGIDKYMATKCDAKN